jgi:hypothetical protein
MSKDELIDLLKAGKRVEAILEFKKNHDVTLSEAESKIDSLMDEYSINFQENPKPQIEHKESQWGFNPLKPFLYFFVPIVLIIVVIKYRSYENKKQKNQLNESTITFSKSPDDQVRFEQEDNLIYNDMRATENSYKLSELENKLSQHRASVGYVKDWYFIVSEVNQGVFDEDLNYDKSLFTMDVRSEKGSSCTIYLDPSDLISMELVKQADKGDRIKVSGDYAWSGMITGFTLKNARIKKAD